MREMRARIAMREGVEVRKVLGVFSDASLTCWQGGRVFF
jgi:hypothetical protein